MITKQEIFDKVVAGLRSQGWKKSGRQDDCSDRFICLYRGPNGLKCAFGHLIPDDLYKRSMEGSSATDDGLSIVWDYLLGPNWKDIDGTLQYRHMVGDLQKAHDNSDDREHMMSQFRDIGIREDLDTSSVYLEDQL